MGYETCAVSGQRYPRILDTGSERILHNVRKLSFAKTRAYGMQPCFIVYYNVEE